jgi:hypothetical protein
MATAIALEPVEVPHCVARRVRRLSIASGVALVLRMIAPACATPIASASSTWAGQRRRVCSFVELADRFGTPEGDGGAHRARDHPGGARRVKRALARGGHPRPAALRELG